MSKNSAAPAALSPGLRKFLYITAGITGACILVIEILGAKMLAPYVGTSHFVWTAQIAVTLISLAVGYYFGGWLADQSPRLDRLYFCIAIAAAYLCFSLLIIEKVAYSFLRYNLALGALFSSALLFFVPLTLLAAVGPYLIRVLAISFQMIGRQVGRLSAISTLGSVTGTVLIGYVLIPFLPNSITMLVTAGILFLTCLVYFLFWRRRAMAPLLLLLAGGLALGTLGVRRDNVRQWEHLTELYKGNSNFGMLQVLEHKQNHWRYYLNDYLVQNTYDPVQKKSTSLFTYMLRYLAQAYTTNLDNVFCIGLGVGITPRELAEHGSTVEVVEINPQVVTVAEKYFDLDPSKLKIQIGDGRYYLNRNESQAYDAVILDAFLGDSSPSHLMTREAFSSIKRILKPGGVLVINSFGDFQPGRNFFTGSLQKTLASVFPSVRIHAIGSGNVFFVASPNPDLQFHSVGVGDAHPYVRERAAQYLESVVSAQPEAGIILTDNYNPVDFYDAANREENRRQLAISLKPVDSN